jgi:putative tryptophan/tyrosine transport system substrate-binding protein
LVWCPPAPRAQQRALPVIGLLQSGSPEPKFEAAFRKGLDETGFVESRNVGIEYRFARNELDRLSEFAADLVRHRVAVIVAPSLPAALAAKSATTTIPIVFRTAADPVRFGLVTSFNRPSGNLTGITSISGDLGPKRLQLLHDLLPAASRFGILIERRTVGRQIDTQIAYFEAAAAIIGRSLEFAAASNDHDIDAAFANLAQKGVDAVLVTTGQLFFDRRTQVVTAAAFHHLPASYGYREIAEIGGLMSYGPDIADTYRWAGIYAGRILKGEKPSELSVMQPVKFEFVINMQTARTLGIKVPPTLVAIADEVIE